MRNQLESLPLADARSIEEACTSFEQRGDYGVDAIEFFLKDCRHEQRAALLEELLMLDAELRTARGERVLASDYECFADPFDIEVARRILAENDLASSQESGRYTFESELGRGGIGSVWRVYDRVSDRPLAIKTLHEHYRSSNEASSRLLKEAILTGKLQHPGIPPVFDRGYLPNGLAYFSMKLVDGETLESALNRRRDADDNFAPPKQCVSPGQATAWDKLPACHSIRDVSPPISRSSVSLGMQGPPGMPERQGRFIEASLLRFSLSSCRTRIHVRLASGYASTGSELETRELVGKLR